MSEFEDDLMDTLIRLLSEKISIESLRKADTKAMRKRLLKCFTYELFYRLLKEKRVDLAPGFGSLVLKDIREKDKKVFDRIAKAMVVKHVRGKKVVYKPGDSMKEFL